MNIEELKMNINQERIENHMEQLSEIGKFGETGVRRLALSKEYRAGIDVVKKWMEDAGL